MKAKDSIKVFSKAIAIPAIIAISAILTDCTMDDDKKKSKSPDRTIAQVD